MNTAAPLAGQGGEPPVLAGARVNLRPLTEADLPLTRAWRNAARHFFVRSEPINEEQHRAWFRRYLEDENDFVWIVEEHRDLHRAVGQVALYGFDRTAARAECGRLLIGDPDARGRGLAVDAIDLAVRWAASDLGLAEVVARIFEHNIASRRSFERAGFRLAGREGDIVHVVRSLRPTPGS